MRGPDGNGCVLGVNAGVGMVRLRVRADESEAEPIRLSPQLTAAYNGEVYWHKGGVPSGGKGEVNALTETKLDDVDGMYALACLSHTDNQLTLQRDPLGIKPLWMRETDFGILAASHPAPLYAAAPVDITSKGVQQFLAFGKPLDQQGLVKGVSQLERGHSVTIRSGEVVEKRLTQGEASNAPSVSAQQLRSAISSSLKRTLVSDRPLGLAISGGLDSTILAYELAQMGVEDLKTVSVRVEGGEDGIQDLSSMHGFSKVVSTWQHHCVTVTPSDFATGLEASSHVLGEPTAMSSVPLYMGLADAVRQQDIVVLLLGEGADELFMGYQSYQSLDFTSPDPLVAFMFSAQKTHYLTRLLGVPQVVALKNQLEGEYPCDFEHSALERLRKAELDLSLGPLLHRADQILMSRSIEGRTPFLHGDVPRLAMSCPPQANLSSGQGKVLLRQAYPELMAQSGPWQVKRAFRAPVHDWLCGVLRPWATEILMDSREVLSEFGIRRDGVAEVCQGLKVHDSGAASIAVPLLSLAFWLNNIKH
ncbi:asparagine synthetase B family protein [Marinomonas sp. 2405UD68-3]|uniref:asparagine synthetase B family protein n=1 Tax=Marinomonas sp. 2405UD68-3 TaxID=3391835 RepID=UPI0039C8D820